MKLLHTHIMNVKGWARGILHHISTKHAQSYLDEYHFRFNRRLKLESAFDKLLLRMELKGWLSYKRASMKT